jgi:hypothetical protein
MTDSTLIQNRIKSNEKTRREEERRFIAEQRFLRARKVNYAEIGRLTGVSANTARDVALGFSHNEAVMTTLLDKWRELVEETTEYEFWREK